MLCPNCGTSNSEGSIFCMGCGRELTKTIVSNLCANCGATNAIGSNFCMSCGLVLATALVAPTAQSIAPARPAQIAKPAQRARVPGRLSKIVNLADLLLALNATALG